MVCKKMCSFIVCVQGEDGGDMKLDFTFDPDLAQFGDDKQTKHMAIARSLSSEISSANSPISPSTDDLNLKIASVKKVTWGETLVLKPTFY